MQTKKISLKEIKGVLSRDEMKKIMAGSGTVPYMGTCTSDSDCAGGFKCVLTAGSGTVRKACRGI